MSFLDTLGGLWNRITGHQSQAEKRAQAKLISDQIAAYKKQTEVTQQEIASRQAEREVEKRKVDEKQIRSLRHRYRPASGFLNQQAKGGAQLSEVSGLNNKLGA